MATVVPQAQGCIYKNFCNVGVLFLWSCSFNLGIALPVFLYFSHSFATCHAFNGHLFRNSLDSCR